MKQLPTLTVSDELHARVVDAFGSEAAYLGWLSTSIAGHVTSSETEEMFSNAYTFQASVAESLRAELGVEQAN